MLEFATVLAMLILLYNDLGGDSSCADRLRMFKTTAQSK